jgi:hypothetical protein
MDLASATVDDAWVWLGQSQVTGKGVAEERANVGDRHVAVEGNGILGCDVGRWATKQVVGHGESLVCELNEKEAFAETVGVMHRVVGNDAVLGMAGEDPCFATASYEVVANNAINAVEPVATERGVAEGDADVAIDEHVALDQAIVTLFGYIDRCSSLAGSSLDLNEDVVADGPAMGVLDVYAADVIAVEAFWCIRFIVGESFGAIVVKQAELDTAVTRI